MGPNSFAREHGLDLTSLSKEEDVAESDGSDNSGVCDWSQPLVLLGSFSPLVHSDVSQLPCHEDSQAALRRCRYGEEQILISLTSI